MIENTIHLLAAVDHEIKDYEHERRELRKKQEEVKIKVHREFEAKIRQLGEEIRRGHESRTRWPPSPAVWTFKERLGALRLKAGSTQIDLATAAGVTLSAITKMEAGEIAIPRFNTVKALANALGCTLDELGKNDDPPPASRRRRPRRRGT
jgi:DNA-binding XRE family transcriptional regulator